MRAFVAPLYACVAVACGDGHRYAPNVTHEPCVWVDDYPISGVDASRLQLALLPTSDGSMLVARQPYEPGTLDRAWVTRVVKEGLVPPEPHVDLASSSVGWIASDRERRTIGLVGTREDAWWAPPDDPGKIVALTEGFVELHGFDGALLWRERFGRSERQTFGIAQGVALAPSGEAFVLGSTGELDDNGDLIAHDAWIARYAETGILEARFPLPNGVGWAWPDVCCTDARGAIALHPSGDVLVAATRGTEGIWAARMTSGGQLVWSTEYPGASRTVAAAAGASAHGELAIVGTTRGTSGTTDLLVWVLDDAGRPRTAHVEDGAAHHADAALAATFSAEGALLVSGALRQGPHASGEPGLDGPGTLFVRQYDPSGAHLFTRLEPSPIENRWSYGLAVAHDLDGTAYVAGYAWAAPTGGAPRDTVLVCATRP